MAEHRTETSVFTAIWQNRIGIERWREHTPRDRPLATLEIANDIHKPSSNDSDSGRGENNEDRREQEAYAEKSAVATTHHAWTLESRLGSTATSA